MTHYLSGRLLALIPTLLGVSILVFVLIRLIPGDVVQNLVGTAEALTPAQAESLRHYYGLDRPWPVQYATWLVGVLHGDFGYSMRSGRPVLAEIVARFPLTLELTVLATLIALVIGLPLGVLSAVRSGTALDLLGRLVALLGLALPNFWLGTLFILLLSVYFGFVPSGGTFTSLTVNPLANLSQLIFPAITLGSATAASVVRTIRSSMLETLGQDYVRTARSKGLAEWPVVTRHALKNALIPVITIVGVQMGYLLGGAVIVEEVFALPGIGRLLLNAINGRDYAVVQGVILFVALNFVLINLLADMLYAFTDPRIRYGD